MNTNFRKTYRDLKEKYNNYKSNRPVTCAVLLGGSGLGVLAASAVIIRELVYWGVYLFAPQKRFDEDDKAKEAVLGILVKAANTELPILTEQKEQKVALDKKLADLDPNTLEFKNVKNQRDQVEANIMNLNNALKRASERIKK